MHARDRELVLSLDLLEQRVIVDEREVAARNRKARLGERHLEVVDGRPEDRQSLVEASELVVRQ